MTLSRGLASTWGAVGDYGEFWYVRSETKERGLGWWQHDLTAPAQPSPNK